MCGGLINTGYFGMQKIRYQKQILRQKKKIREGTKRKWVGKTGRCGSLEFKKQTTGRETNNVIGVDLA